jgi:predicted anti-sigma-YlaC factor YlaD
MKREPCRKLLDWLEQFPVTEISKTLEDHLDTCPECRESHKILSPVVRTLSEIPPPEKLSDDTLAGFSAAAVKEKARLANRRTALRLVRNMLLGLPVAAGINLLWIKFGSLFLASTVSSRAALVYTIILAISASFAAALVFGSIPLLWGFYRKRRLEEC